MQRNPLFTRERATFYFDKIEYYYKNKAYSQALEEIEKNKDLLGAVLNVGKQLSLNKIYAGSIVNVMLDIFEVDGNTELFDEHFMKYRTTLELHTDPQIYSRLQAYHTEKNRSSALSSRKERTSRTVEDKIGEYIDNTVKTTSAPKQKDNRARSIEEDFLNSIGKPLIVPTELKEAVRTEEKEIYGSKDDFDGIPVYETIPANKRPAQKKAAPAPEAKQPSEDKPSREKSSDDTGHDSYVKNHTVSKSVSKSGGRVTELEFTNTEKQERRQTQSPSQPKSPSTQQSPENRPRKKTGAAKPKKKKKKSPAPLIISVIAVLILSAAFYGALKSGMLDSIINPAENPSASQDQEGSGTPQAPDTGEASPQDQPQDQDTSLPEDPSAGDGTQPETDTPAEEAADSEYILPSDIKYLTEEDLAGMDKSQIRYAINEMYARRGWHFDFGGEYYEYFMTKSWYKPDGNISSPAQAASSFTEIENVNLATIVKYRDSLS